MVFNLDFQEKMTILSRIFNKNSHGSARWSNFFETRKIVNSKNTGFVVDGINHISDELSFQNMLLLAPTGMQKTVKFVVPNMMRQKFSGSTVVMDPSGEIYERTASSLQKAGANVIVICPFEQTNEHFSIDETNYYNPLKNVKTLSEAKETADILVDQVRSKGNPFWDKAGGSLLSALIYFLSVFENGKYSCFASLRTLLSFDDDDRESYLSQVENRGVNEEYSLYSQSKDEVKASILATAKSAISIFSDEKIDHLTRSNDFDFSELRTKDTILYVIIPQTKVNYCRGFLALFYKQLLNHLMDKKNKENSEGHQVRVILEEFGNIGRIPDIDNILNTCRKMRIAISLILQELKQVRALYGNDEGEAILSGCVSKMYYPGIDSLDTLKMVSGLLGTKTIETSNYHSRNESISYQYSSRSLLNPDEVKGIPDDSAIFMCRNYRPIFFKKVTPFYLQPFLNQFVDYGKVNFFKFKERPKTEYKAL